MPRLISTPYGEPYEPCSDCGVSHPESELRCAWTAAWVSECDCAACLGEIPGKAPQTFEAYCEPCWAKDGA